jgi:hypothetical protein
MFFAPLSRHLRLHSETKKTARGCESDEGIHDGTSRVVAEVCLDVAVNDLARLVDLSSLHRRGTARGVGDTHAVRGHSVNESIQLQDVGRIRAEGVLPGEAISMLFGLAY